MHASGLLFATTGDAGASDAQRELGVVVCRGTAVTLVCPKEGMEQIANPFADADDEDGASA